MRYFTLLTILLFTACQTSTTVNTINATITGAEKESKLVVQGQDFIKEFDIKDGIVKDTLSINKPGVYSFTYQRKRLLTYLEPGQNLNFSANADAFEKSAVFQGDHEDAWTYFKQKREITRTSLSQRKLYTMEPAVFLDSLNKAIDRLNNTLSNATTLPSSLVAIEKEAIAFEKKHELYSYPFATNKKVDSLPTEFKDPLAGINFQDETKFLENASYKKLVRTHFSIEMSNDASGGEYIDSFMSKIEVLPEGNIRNDLIGAMQHLMKPDERLDEYLDFYKKYSTNKKNISKMEEKYASLQGLLKGNISPTFDYENYKGGNTKLSDFKGKYVYIDIWATWCAPCIVEIPFLKQKEAKYHDSNVEFVSISIDTEKAYDTWKNMIQEKELGGSQLIADKQWGSKFLKDYKINSIPRFILIDPEGKIVAADAPRPSSDKFDETFKSLGL